MTEQEKREKVINGLGSCVEYFACKVKGGMFDEWLEESRKAIALLKAQEQEAVDAPKPDSDIGCWYDITHNYALEQVVSALKAQEPKIISLRDVVCADEGNVVWLETYYDGKTGIEPFLVCIDFTQKPVIINGWDSFYNISEQELNDDIVNSFADGFTVRKFRFWNARPTEEQRKAVKWDA